MSDDPWQVIPKSDHPSMDNVRVVDPEHPLLFRRGKDYQGRYLFFLEGSEWELCVKDLPRLSGIDIDLVEGVPERLTLTLIEKDQKDIFRALCLNLVEATRGLEKGDSRQGAIIVVNRIKRWQELLKIRSEGALSKPEIIGLVGELLFLKNVLMTEMDISDAVHAWTGPFENEQDFALKRCVVEVKTQLVTSDKSLRISSEHQLDGRSVPVLIWHLLLGVVSASDPQRLTLNNLVSSLQPIVLQGGAGAVDAFNTALMEVGYWPRPEYDDYSWIEVESRFFEVREGFPSITPSELRSGIRRVSYSIDMEACLEFIISDEDAVEKLFHETDRS